jgi:hypothetical protein
MEFHQSKLTAAIISNAAVTPAFLEFSRFGDGRGSPQLVNLRVIVRVQR